jgi:NTP pyrophosphatase (non-canonical NTP hydrolase)
MSNLRTLVDQVIATDVDGDLSPRIDAWFEADKELTPALESVLDERKKQDDKWGEQNHNPYIYHAILVEEVGELAQAILQTQFGGKHGGFSNMRKEAIHVAAVALAWVECLDRDKWVCAVEFNYPIPQE